VDKESIIKELQFKAVRSSGAGGQHVNKVSSKIEVLFDIPNAKSLTEVEKEKLILKLKARLTKDNLLLLQCDVHRSQHRNKELAIQRFLVLIANALKVPKKRKPTKPSKSAIEKRLKSKKKAAEKKVNRSKPSWD